MKDTTYIIVVNWNGWADTLECLESVFRLQTAPFKVIVCDNGSNDGSVDKITQWAEGHLPAQETDETIRHSSSLSAVPKPIPYESLSTDEQDDWGSLNPKPLTILSCEENLGFAGGNNVGIRFALQQEDMGWVWLLNNDTVVDPDALDALVRKQKSKPDAGQIGSTIYYYDSPDEVQALGGARYLSWLGLAKHLKKGPPGATTQQEEAIEQKMDYVIGASMFIRRAFLEQIGLMSEDYFLYYEEIDWALRGKPAFSLGFAGNSKVYHKAGSSLNSSHSVKHRGDKADYYLMYNRLQVTSRFYPRRMMSVKCFLLVELMVRLLLGKTKRAHMIWRLLWVHPQTPTPSFASVDLLSR